MAEFDLESTFLAIDGKGEVIELPVGPDFWQTIDTSPAATRSMVSVYASSGDWENWEMHPAGQEVLVLIDGALEMLMDDGARQWTEEMVGGTTLIVPAGVWHRARVSEPGRLLAITYGAGTMHRPA